MFLVAGDDPAQRYLRQQIGISPAPLVRGRKPNGIRALTTLVERIFSDDRELHERLFQKYLADGEFARPILRYKKNRVLEKAMIEKQDPEGETRRGKVTRFEFLNKKRDLIQNVPSQEAEFMFSDMLEMGPIFRRELEGLWRTVRKDDCLTGQVFHFVRERMKDGDDWIRLRDLYRRFTKKKAELRPVLERLRDHHLISWDTKIWPARAIQANSYDPGDKRNFRWLAGPTWPRSPFEPYLETGKTYSVRDFRGYVVDEWIRAGAAELA